MFYVDDRFYSSDPVVRIPRSRRAEAVGTWTLCGTWSAHFLKDGYVPAHMLEEIGGTLDGAEALVAVGLWRRRRGTGGGWQFNDWERWQKTREEVEAFREKDRQRKADDRARAADKRARPHGQVAESALSNPSSNPQTRRTTKGQSEGDLGSNDSHVQNPVNKSAYGSLLDQAASYLAGVAGEPISKLQAGLAVDLILERGGRRVRNPERYVMGTLRKSGPEWLQYIFRGKEPE